MAELLPQTTSITSFTGAVFIAAALQAPYPESAFTVNPSIIKTEASESFSGPLRPLPSDDDVKTFQKLADQWRRETMDISSLTEMVSHPAYLAIIGMGNVATPLLLSELEKKPSHWFVALAAINRCNPVPVADAGNLKKMTEAWLKWGRQTA